MFSKLIHIRHKRIFIGSTAAIIVLCFACTASAQTQKPNLPDPVKYTNKYDMVLNAVRAVLKEDYDIELEDRKAGKIITRPYEFISGSLTASEVEKVAIINNMAPGHWIKARYSVEAIIEFVTPVETLVTVNTSMEALNRSVDGTEEWFPIESLGTYERRILGKISAILMGKQTGTKKEGFWGQRPQPIDPRTPRFPDPDR
jgi:hypothetical protein